MNSVLISGFYGFGNLGDEAILETMLRRICDNPNIEKITVLSNNPELTKKDYSVNSISRKNVFRVVKGIFDCDILISGGGSLLQDVTSKKSIFYYFFIIFIGILFKKKVMLYSHGIGPINIKRNKSITKYLLNKVDCITVREMNSMSDLIEMGVEKELIYVTADPVIDMEKGSEKLGLDYLTSYSNYDKNKKSIGISIRSKDFINLKAVDELESLLGELVENYNVIMMPFYLKEDLQISQKMAQKFDNIVVLDKKTSVHETLNIVSCFDILIGTRLHSLIFGAVCNIPLIGMTYDPKIDYFLDTLGQKPALKIEEFHKNSIIEEISYIENNYENIKLEIKQDVEKLRRLLDLNDILLSKLIV